MLHDKTVLKAITGIKQRSERHGSLDTVSRTFVDPGILLEVDNINHQVVFGRRGTGKTHLLRMLQANMHQSDSFSCFIDCRSVGSTAQSTDESLSIKHRSFSIFRDILNEVYDVLLNRIVELSPDNSDILLAELDLFLSEFSRPYEIIKSATVTDNIKKENSSDESAGVGVAIAGRIGFDLSHKANKSSEVSDSITYSVEFDDKAVFLSVSKKLSKLVKALGGSLYILLDEWSAIPFDVQPYLAEFIKRALLPANNITLKIAALEFRSCFFYILDNKYLGIELGADIATAPSMDSFYSYDQDEKRLEATFSEMLYRHISSELPFDYLRRRYRVYDGDTLMSAIFDTGAFVTLTQASEGVIRDLINVFIIAFSRVMKLNSYERTKITIEIIYESAKRWFERDKMKGLSNNLHEKYTNILRQAISKNKSRYFLVARENVNTKSLDQLIDLRILHLTSESFMSFLDNLTTYKVYNIDFGAYASLMDFDSKSKYGDIPFFDIEGFSKYPVPTEDIGRYMMNESYLQ